MLTQKNYGKKQKDEILDSMIIVVDKREKSIDHIIDMFERHDIMFINKSLSSGDYSILIPANQDLDLPCDLWLDKEIFIERKSGVDELCNNLGKHRDRFENEFIRSTAKRKILLIEGCTYSDIVQHNYKSKMSPKAIWNSLMAFYIRYDIQVVFVEKHMSGSYIYNVLRAYVRELLK